MSEAPKKIWVDPEGTMSLVKIVHDDTQYIRSDIADELVKALEIAAQVFRTYEAYHEYRDAFDKADRNRGYAEQMEAAIKLMEEEA